MTHYAFDLFLVFGYVDSGLSSLTVYRSLVTAVTVSASVSVCEL